MVNSFDDIPNFFPSFMFGKKLGKHAVKKIQDSIMISRIDLWLSYGSDELKDLYHQGKIQTSKSAFYFKLNDALKPYIKSGIIVIDDNHFFYRGLVEKEKFGKFGNTYGWVQNLPESESGNFTFGKVPQEIIMKNFQVLNGKRRFQRINGIFEVTEWGLLKVLDNYQLRESVLDTNGYVVIQKQFNSLEVYLACPKPGFTVKQLIVAWRKLDEMLLAFGIAGRDKYYTFEVRSSYKGKVKGLRSNPIYRTIIEDEIYARIYQHKDRVESEFRVNGSWDRAHLINQVNELVEPANGLLLLDEIRKEARTFNLLEEKRFERSQSQFESLGNYIGENSHQFTQLQKEVEFASDNLILVQNQMMNLEADKLQGDTLLETLNRMNDKLDRDEQKLEKLDQLNNSIEEIKNELAAIKKQNPDENIWSVITEDERIKFIDAIKSLGKISWEKVGNLLEHDRGNVNKYYNRRKTSRQQLINKDNIESFPNSEKDNDLLNDKIAKQILEFIKNNSGCNNKSITSHVKKRAATIIQILRDLETEKIIVNEKQKLGQSGYSWRMK